MRLIQCVAAHFANTTQSLTTNKQTPTHTCLAAELFFDINIFKFILKSNMHMHHSDTNIGLTLFTPKHQHPLAGVLAPGREECEPFL